MKKNAIIHCLKKMKKEKFLLSFALFFVLQITYPQTSSQDTLNSFKTIGFFNGKKTTIGNMERVNVYKINDYYIYNTDISQILVDSIKGKTIIVTGELQIIKGDIMPAKTTDNDIIYEPYKEPEKKIIINPTFEIIY